MNKHQKARIGLLVIIASLTVILIYAWDLPWWFAVMFLSPGLLTILIAIIYKKIIMSKKLIMEDER